MLEVAASTAAVRFLGPHPASLNVWVAIQTGQFGFTNGFALVTLTAALADLTATVKQGRITMQHQSVWTVFAVWTVFLGLCLFVVPTSHALTIAYGQQDIETAGVGCVGGWISEHGNIAYFRGNTERLNHQLAEIARSISNDGPATIVLHTGEKLVDNPNEKPLTGFGDQKPKQMPVDWSVRRTCPSDDLLRGRCQCDRRLVTVDIWIARAVTLDALKIPAGFTLESGREIEKFMDRQTIRN